MPAFQFEQHGDAFSQGWRWTRQGYLAQREWLFALAIFCRLRGESVSAAKAYLKPALFKDLSTAAGYVGRNSAVAALAAGSIP